MTSKNYAFAVLLLTCAGCGPKPDDITTHTASCECTIFPFPKGCDSACGITDAVVESVHADSITVRLPAKNGQPSEMKTIALSSLRLTEKVAPKAGAQIRLTYQRALNEPESGKRLNIKSLVPAH